MCGPGTGYDATCNMRRKGHGTTSCTCCTCLKNGTGDMLYMHGIGTAAYVCPYTACHAVGTLKFCGGGHPQPGLCIACPSGTSSPLGSTRRNQCMLPPAVAPTTTRIHSIGATTKAPTTKTPTTKAPTTKAPTISAGKPYQITTASRQAQAPATGVCRDCTTRCPAGHRRAGSCGPTVTTDYSCVPCTTCGLRHYSTGTCSPTRCAARPCSCVCFDATVPFCPFNNSADAA